MVYSLFNVKCVYCLIKHCEFMKVLILILVSVGIPHPVNFFRFGPYFVEPVVAGLNTKTHEPYIATMDLIGCPMETKDFVVGGTCTEQLYGMCESLWNPDMVRGHPHFIFTICTCSSFSMSYIYCIIMMPIFVMCART